MFSTFRGFLRAILLAITLAAFMAFLILRTLILGYDLKWSVKWRKKFIHAAMIILGLQVETQGNLPKGTYIFVSNHRSYIDPAAELVIIEALPVAKAEVADWPLIGFSVKMTGVMYVKRTDKSSRLQTLKTMNQTLKKGFSVFIYPEGTTHMEPKTRPFRKGGFQLAAKEGFAVVPVAIEYQAKEDAWVGEETFVPHFLKTFSKNRTKVKVRFGQPIRGEDGEILLQQVQQWIDENMVALREEWS